MQEKDMLQLNEMYRRPLRDLGFRMLPINPSTQKDVKTEHKLMQRKLIIITSERREAEGVERKGKQPSRDRQKTHAENRGYKHPGPFKDHQFLQYCSGTLKHIS